MDSLLLIGAQVEESDWELGYDAVDGGTTASVAAVVDGRTLIYASVGDSCGVFAKPNKADKLDVFEIVPEHSPTNMKVSIPNWHSLSQVAFTHVLCVLVCL